MGAVYLRVRLRAEHYALPVEQVLEVLELGPVTPVPGTPDMVLGVCNRRGDVLVAVDLARALGVPREGRTDRLVVGTDGERSAGLVVDEVVGVAALPSPAPSSTQGPLCAATVVSHGESIKIITLPALLDTLSTEART